MRVLEISFFLWVAACFAAACFIKRPVSKRDVTLLRLAMGLTAAADFCMLVLGRDLPGLLFFIAAQSVYVLRYANIKWWPPMYGCAALLAGGLAADGADLLTWLAGAYGACLLWALGTAIVRAARAKKQPPYWWSAVGMVLFLGCDICVGLYQLPAMAGVWPVIWVFYLPSQAMLMWSGRGNGNTISIDN